MQLDGMGMKYWFVVWLLVNGLTLAEEQNEGIPMSKLMFVLNITDLKTYQLYRSKIEPLMEKLDVRVLEEYEVANVLKSASGSSSINRVALFGFPSESVKQAFFSDPEYIAAKPLFEASTMNFQKILE